MVYKLTLIFIKYLIKTHLESNQDESRNKKSEIEKKGGNFDERNFLLTTGRFLGRTEKIH